MGSNINTPISADVRQVVSCEIAWHYRVVPFNNGQWQIEVYIDENVNIEDTVSELKVLLGREVSCTAQSREKIDEFLLRNYPLNKSNQTLTAKEGADDYVECLIKESKELGSSDIHIEPYEEGCRVRIRIDGQLVERYKVSKSKYPAIVNRIKVMSRLDISEKRLPQDGRISFNFNGNKFDIRVSFLPTLYGEKIVLRILNNDISNISLNQLGFAEVDLRKYTEAIKQPNGIILISGPTGSGKTTTLYATLKELNKSTRNILTIEDPVEYTLEGINQVQLKEDIGMGFASTLRTFLRQDPDIIMVGEIRDVDTAKMAIRAALTGHLVLSTIHTNSAWGIISRLVDMGIPPFMVADTLNMAVAQRLVRRLCPQCKKEALFEKSMLPDSYKADILPSLHFTAVGCDYCYYTGYKGRKAIYEVIQLNDGLKEKVKNSDLYIEHYLKENKIRLLSDQAFDLVLSGETSIEEAYSLLFHI
jgi:general secretion pathway protein E/type IV pilus assembly protein PilB